MAICILSKQVQDMSERTNNVDIELTRCPQDTDTTLFNSARQETAGFFQSIKRRVRYDEDGSDTEGSSVAFKCMRIDGSSTQDEYMKQV